MTVDTIIFPGYNDNELDLTKRSQEPVGTPAGLAGAAERGPAFVPWNLGSFADFSNRFGGLNSDYPASYAADVFLKNRTNLTFMRVLGAGSNEVIEDIETTRVAGTVKNAGFRISASAAGPFYDSAVTFLVAQHDLQTEEAFGYPVFTNNDSYNAAGGTVNLVRGVIFAASGSRVQILDTTETYSPLADAFGSPDSNGLFKIAISSSEGLSFANDDGNPGVRLVTASLNPISDNYVGKILNKDPQRFAEYKHYLYLDLAVDDSIATVAVNTGTVGALTGSINTSAESGIPTEPFLQAFGRFDTRYKTAGTPWFISQPFGSKEYDLFRFEALDDGQFPNGKIKISIANLNSSVNPRDPYGSFTVLVRRFDDTDYEPIILEQFVDCSLNPDADNFIAKKIGDIKYSFNFDAENEDDRRVLVTGRYPLQSRYIRVILNDVVERKELPETVLPFGFRGLKVLKTNVELEDFTTPASGDVRLDASGSAGAAANLLNALIPPLPFTFKTTRGELNIAGTYLGAPGANESTDPRIFWGMKTTNISNPLNANVSSGFNQLAFDYTKFMGIEKLDVLVTGSHADELNENKFTLARVAFNKTALTQLTNSVASEMREVAYVRNGVPDGTNYTIVDPVDTVTNRITLATLLQRGETPTVFNRFSQFAKFTAPVVGGFDGTNILSKDDALLTDKATSQEARGSETGHANELHISKGFYSAQAGTGLQNSTVKSYRAAIDLLTDPFISQMNILCLPGQRDPLVTDYALDAIADYGTGIYLLEIPDYNTSNERIFFGEVGQYFDAEYTADNFEARALDNRFGAVYYPDFKHTDRISQKNVTLPASIAALAAYGYTDKVAYSWFAPAGFNRASLEDIVKTSLVKLSKAQKERLYGIDINPIGKLPGEKSFVIFSQETLQKGNGVLTKVNVQRMIGEIIKQCADFSNRNIFEGMEFPELFNTFTDGFKTILAPFLNKKGLKEFKVICDVTNNTSVDQEEKQINAKVILVPIGAVEYIILDFIIVRGSIEAQVSTAAI